MNHVEVVERLALYRFLTTFYYTVQIDADIRGRELQNQKSDVVPLCNSQPFPGLTDATQACRALWSDSTTANPGQRLTVPDSLTALTALL